MSVMADRQPSWLTPDWPAPPGVRSLSTLREGGYSSGVFRSLNLGDHVGDDAATVQRNRDLVMLAAALPSRPLWLTQVHGTRAIDAAAWRAGVAADACVASGVGQVCAVLTADCLPVLLCDRSGMRVAAVHAGWRGLAGGVVEHAIAAMDAAPAEILAWLGPAIGPAAFEVGDEVREAFVAAQPEAAALFRPRGARWMADLAGLACLRLRAVGVTAIHGGAWCTVKYPGRFFSYRRDGVTGRMATLIWRE